MSDEAGRIRRACESVADNPSPREVVSEAWARWAADDIVEDLLDLDIVSDEDEDRAREVVVNHLYDIAMSNAPRGSGQPESVDAKKL